MRANYSARWPAAFTERTSETGPSGRPGFAFDALDPVTRLSHRSQSENTAGGIDPDATRRRWAPGDLFRGTAEYWQVFANSTIVLTRSALEFIANSGVGLRLATRTADTALFEPHGYARETAGASV